MNNVKFALRQLVQRHGATLVILATFVLVIGTSCLVLGVIQHERSAWMPFPDADRVVRLWQFGKSRPEIRFPAKVSTVHRTRFQT